MQRLIEKGTAELHKNQNGVGIGAVEEQWNWAETMAVQKRGYTEKQSRQVLCRKKVVAEQIVEKQSRTAWKQSRAVGIQNRASQNRAELPKKRIERHKNGAENSGGFLQLKLEQLWLKTDALFSFNRAAAAENRSCLGGVRTIEACCRSRVYSGHEGRFMIGERKKNIFLLLL